MTIAKTQPNIVFLLTDDQRFNTIRALGNPHIHTPHMDALVKAGTTFTHAHIPGGTSGAVCMPSRAMLNTGRTLFHLQRAGDEIPADHATLGETFRKHGYRTFGAGKWHNGKAAYHRSFSEGAEIFFGGMADHWNVPAYDFDPTGRYDKTCLIVEDPFHSNATKARSCDHIHSGRHSTDVIVEAVIRFIDHQSGDAPFLAYTAFLAPHDPRTMPAKYLALYDPDTIPVPENFMDTHPFDNGELKVRDELLAAFPRTPAEVRRHLAEYYAMISHLDDRIGDIVNAVRRKGLLDNTIFVLAGDNGLALGQHGLFGKQSLYEHSTRVPLILAGPGVPRDVRSRELVYLLDIFPTLCSLSSVPIPETVEGRSLVPVMRGQEPGRGALYLAYTDKHRGVRTDRFKLIDYVVNGRRTMTQLFDLAEDPLELKNRAGDPALKDQEAALRRELIRLRDAWNDLDSPWGKTFWEGHART
jgi:arylsulfatase A-like enzyme